MNDRNNKSSDLFTSSGCLTGDALLLFVNSSLKGPEYEKAEQHIATCPLCYDAADGLRMWLKENNPDQVTATGSPENLASQTPEGSDNEPLARVLINKQSGKVLNKFHARTDVINKRIKQQLHSYSIIEATESKRLSYKPFVWIAAAASVILFIGGFYVVWLQNQLDITKLAEERASQMLMLQNPANPDTLTILFPGSNAILALEAKKAKGTLKQHQNITGVAVSDEETMNQDELSVNVPEAEVIQEAEQKEEITLMREESQVAQTDIAYSAPVSKNSGAVMKKAETVEESMAVFTIVEEMPSFPGGDAERIKYLADNIIYPKQAAENSIQGTVYVSFIVTARGNIENIKVLRGIGGGCDEEALRVIKKMPRWKPGRQNGKQVRVLYNMPVYFKLHD